MNCSICKKPVVLIPTAAERARKFGGKPSDYTRLFTYHADCYLEKRKAETTQLSARYRAGLVGDIR